MVNSIRQRLIKEGKVKPAPPPTGPRPVVARRLLDDRPVPKFSKRAS